MKGKLEHAKVVDLVLAPDVKENETLRLCHDGLACLWDKLKLGVCLFCAGAEVHDGPLGCDHRRFALVTVVHNSDAAVFRDHAVVVIVLCHDFGVVLLHVWD